MRWVKRALATDRLLYVATCLFLVGVASLYVHLDMRRTKQGSSPILISRRIKDGFEEYHSGELYLEMKGSDEILKWWVLGSTNPTGPEFAVIVHTESTSRAGVKQDSMQLRWIAVDGTRLSLSLRPLPDRVGRSVSKYEGKRADLAAIVAGKSVVFDFGQKRFEMSEFDRDVLKALLRGLDRTKSDTR